MPLTDDIKADIRRHLEFPIIGLPFLSPAGGTVAAGSQSWRFLQVYGFLENRMNVLAPAEEAMLTGKVFASIAMTGPQPNTGDTLSVTIAGAFTGSPVTIAATMPGPSGIDGRLVLLTLLANLCARNSALQAAGFVALQPYGTGAFSQNAIPFPECLFTAPVAFTLTATASGASYPQVTSPGGQIGPSTQLAPNVTIWGYVPILNGLENYFGQASQNLDTKQAGPWHSRSNEIGLRTSLYRHWQMKLSTFMGIPLNPQSLYMPSRVGALKYA